ncbi:carboxymuconolactone decarboxylase family protein [Parapusillimonas granuli]|uniref:Carboxymuconolactone decarboxylase family protein n=1 Tax=Parapusillimonas granuli TaxID=380911 RepID=A0A853FTW1_9BURK|nr:carboxymuconolactone decarboxylase family protein [Parapusillimonas granuli]MBB5215046.1 AhpD family alkylhydroperoxidase [Parapusillimonas granuli]MEB2401708.1 carboxymuconolactone decarboxylase family protein [Alcaligenaceae bacterium]NYT49365.1 carboxymuconolactone decarboxylase family protein [Parapusillimonas granuli]
MLNNWPELLQASRKAGAGFSGPNPGMMAAFQNLNAAQGSNGALDAKMRELIALAVAVTTRCDGCIAAHAAAARKAGVTEAELSDALGTAIALNAGAAYIYSVRVMDAFGQFEKA